MTAERIGLSHFSKEYSQEIQKYAHSEVFNQYIFVWKEDKYYQGYCTHCNSEIGVPQLKHGELHICPICRHECVAKQAGRGRKYMIDEVYFIYYEKSIIDPKVMVARGIYAVRDYRVSYRNVETQYGARAHYIFEMGNPVMLESYAYYSWSGKRMSVGDPWERKNFNSLFSQFPARKPKTAVGCCFKSIDNAVKGTPFQYSCYDEFGGYGGLVKYFDMYSKYPIIESLTKIGFKEIVEAKFHENCTYGAVNWRGKTIQKALRMNKREIREIITLKKVDCHFMRLYQISKKDGSNLSVEEIESLKHDIYDLKILNAVLKYTTLRKAVHYAKNQRGLNKKSYYSLLDALSNWRDYIKDCTELQKNLKSDSILFPKNLHKAHQETNKQIKVKESEIFNKKIAGRAKTLEYLCFEQNGLLIRPAASSKEMVDEGDALGHCVARHYMGSYADGRTNILFIRKVSAPNKSFYTVEVKDNRIIQCRGRGNKTPDANKHVDVENFIEAFKAEKLTEKKTKSKVKITA